MAITEEDYHTSEDYVDGGNSITKNYYRLSNNFCHRKLPLKLPQKQHISLGKLIISNAAAEIPSLPRRKERKRKKKNQNSTYSVLGYFVSQFREQLCGQNIHFILCLHFKLLILHTFFLFSFGSKLDKSFIITSLGT